MIIGQQQNDIVKTGIDSSKKATINQDKLAKLQNILTKGLYSDAESAVIVEWTNNGIDSVVQSNKNPIENPVIVTITEKEFSVEDFGTGLDKDDFENVVMSYLSSTKENDNSQIGNFGLGSKSFLALDRAATFLCRKDGVEYKFLCYQGHEFMEYDLIYEKQTTEPNGVKCSININGWKEYNSFVSKAKQKLAYYDTVVLNIDGVIIENNIIRSEKWQFSSENSEKTIHLCLKDVFYKIDYSRLDIPAVNMPIALRFNLNEGLIPTPSRESLIWNTHTINLVKERIKETANYFVTKYNESVPDERELLEAWGDIGKESKYVELAGESFHINSLIKYSDIKPKELKIKGIELKTPQYYANLSNKYLNNYETIVDFTESVWRSKRIYRKHNINSLFEDKKLILVNEVPKGKLKTYLLEKYRGKIFIIKKIKERGLGSVKYVNRNEKDYLYTLGLGTEKDKSKWRGLIQEFQFVENQFKSLIIDETNCEFTKEYQDWLVEEKERVKNNRKEYKSSPNYKGLNKELGDITIVYFKRIKGGRMSLKKDAYKISTLKNNSYLTVYTSMKEREDEFKVYARMFPKVKFALIGKNEVKKLPKIHNFIKINQFMSQLTKPFVKVVTANKVNNLLETYDNLINNNIIENVLKALHKDIETLESYKDDYYCSMDEEVSNSVYEYAKENNIWDREIMEVVNRVEKGMQDYEFISILEEPRSSNEAEIEKYKKFINQMLLFKKLYNKESLPQYELVLKEETTPILEEQLETV